MHTRILATALIALLSINSTWAQDCSPTLGNVLPNINVPDVGLQVSTNANFCFDPSIEKNPETIKKFDSLKAKKVFDENNCLIDQKFDETTNSEITDLIVQTIRDHLNVYAISSSYPSEKSPLVMTNSENKTFVNNALNKLTTKDALEIGGAAVIGSLIGIVVERNSSSFKNADGRLQHDKLLHANVGALINIGSVGVAYLALETAGLGDKLKLTKNQKKWAILLTGTLMGLLVGYGKERFYDYYHRDIHTYDPKLKGDMGATWLGGGAFNFVGGAISFQF